MTEELDVLIVGAGPAGTSAAAVLAEKGWRVQILEKQAFPRYRLGESLIPHCWFPLNRLGLTEKLDESGFIVHKHSVQFINTEGVRSAPFYFQEHRDHPSSRTWQVVRSDFDQLLLSNALEKGARFQDRTTATELLEENGRVVGVRARDANGAERDYRARMTIDASGRDTFAQNANRWRIADQALKKVSIWTYFEGAKRDPGIDEGATTIAYLPEKGWFWYIPLADDRVSTGVVAERDYLFGQDTKDPETIFAREVQRQPWIRDHLAPGKQITQCQVTGDFTYRARHCATDGLVLVGDAFSFLDPVFSSGVLLALHGGINAADAIDAGLRENDISAARFAAYGKQSCQAIEGMRRLVFAFYDSDFNFADFLAHHPDMRAPLTDCLIGDLKQDFDPLFAAMSSFARIPEPLPHGAPLER